ncbi:unnamed protein product [Miscanthus lutarioriparius]|uniref:Helitron helicase-like domain-containing protein n=1 Tax=Miscanthus lutarioriparius TaxID=422564 RepID=A0A811PEM2_9POAL|nr:unnamed protein product [Miscanthus lutarioriparius]
MGRKLMPKNVRINEIAQKEESRAKNREYQRDRYVALPNHKKEEFREKNREYQHSRRVRLKAEAEITDSRMDDKGNSCKRKRDIASQVDNIDQGTPEDQDTLKHMAKKRYRHAMPGDKKDEVLAKNVLGKVYINMIIVQKKVDQEPFNSDIWEPEDTLHGMEENDLDQQNPNEDGPDIYEDDEARMFNDKDFKYEYSIEPITRINGHDPYNFVYVGLPETHHVLNKVENYFYCRAKRFEGEGPAFCCRNGWVNIFIPEVSDQLYRLFTSQTDKDAKYFRRNICYFNSHFSFTSMGISIDRSLETAKGPTLVEINDVSETNVHEEEITESRRYVSTREYLCFRLQIREGEFNVMFHGGRLFQHWAIDMYVKVESMCLDWYSKPAHQDLIRADLYQIRCI